MKRGYTLQKNEVEAILPYSQETLLSKVEAKLKPKRFEHVKRVADTAVSLAAKYGADTSRAWIAGIVHDYAKQLPDAAFKQVIADQKLDPDLLSYGNGIWHGEVGVYFIEKDLQIHDAAILSAVAKHTVGADEMSDLDQIIFIADFIEPGRDFPGVDEARTAAQTSLKAGVSYELTATMAFLIEQRQPIYPKTLTSYNAWVNR